MAEPKEPQSYGSEKDWVTGNVEPEVNRQKGHPNSQHSDFYATHEDKQEKSKADANRERESGE